MLLHKCVTIVTKTPVKACRGEGWFDGGLGSLQLLSAQCGRRWPVSPLSVLATLEPLTIIMPDLGSRSVLGMGHKKAEV